MTTTQNEWSGKVALVTGGGSGIGRAVVELLARRGARVVFCDRDVAAVDEVTHLLGVSDPIRGVVVDVTDETAVTAFVDRTAHQFGRLDVVVTAAGVQRYGVAADTASHLWDEVFEVNVKGCLHVVRAAIPHLRTARGSIVLVSSVQAFVAQNNAAAYVTSKAALNGLARSLAVDEAPYGVRANVVCPGSVDTPMLRASALAFSDGTDLGRDSLLTSWGALHPMGRIACPDEVAEAVAFLGSDRASFITGVALPVDGGLVASVAVAVDA